jgi:hypothetical protein
MSSSIIRTPNNQDSTPEEHPDGDAHSVARSVAKHVTDDDGQRPVTLDERLADWSSMARGAFAANTLRAWRADWERRGVTVGDPRYAPTITHRRSTPCVLSVTLRSPLSLVRLGIQRSQAPVVSEYSTHNSNVRRLSSCRSSGRLVEHGKRRFFREHN